MVLVLQQDQGLREGILGAGNVLGNALQQYQQNQQQKNYGNILASTLGTLPENATPQQILGALAQTQQQGVPFEMSNKYGTLFSVLNKNRPISFTPEKKQEFTDALESLGLKKERASQFADVWEFLTPGGQTEISKTILDELQRKAPFSGTSQSASQMTLNPQEEITAQINTPQGQIDIQESYKFPNIKEEVFGERTPKEKAKFKSELLKLNSPKYNESLEGVKAAEDELFRFQQMETLNRSGKLPEGAEAFLNVNWATGEIRYPRLSTPEAQAYVKLVNDFTTKAKDSYGARVTNFELARFLKRLPTLANSQEGRQLILDQLQYATEVNRLEADAVKEIYDHYGTQNITPSLAQREARKLIKPQVDELRKKAVNNLKDQEKLDARKRTRPGYIPVRKPDGSIGQVPQEKIEEVTEAGWEIL